MATDHKEMSEEEIRKALQPFDAIRDQLPVEKNQISAPPEIRSGEWVEELESAHASIERGIKALCRMNDYETASTLRRIQKAIGFILATHRSSSTARTETPRE